MMRCTFLANCGVLLESNDASILVDAPNGLHTQFDGVSQDEHKAMVAGLAPYDGLCGMFFTHRHADHYDKKRVMEITAVRQNVGACVPNGATPTEGVVQAGPFLVRYFTIAHSGEEFSEVPHRVILAEAEGKRIYLTGDACWGNTLHQSILETFCPDAAIWNPNFVTHAEGRELLAAASRNYIYHMPVSVPDSFGIAAKCRTCMERYGSELQNTQVVEEYPYSIVI